MPTTSANQAAENLRLALDAGQAGARKALGKVGQQIVNDVRASLSSPGGPVGAGRAAGATDGEVAGELAGGGAEQRPHREVDGAVRRRR